MVISFKITFILLISLMDFNQYQSVNEPVHVTPPDINGHTRFTKQRVNLSQPKDMKTPIKNNQGISLTYQKYSNSAAFSDNTNLPSCAKIRLKTLYGNSKNGRINSSEGVLSNFWTQKREKNTERCATEHSSISLADKFGWKSIPENLQIKRKYTFETNKMQLNTRTNNNLLRPQKAITMTQTKVSTNGFQSLQISKQIQKEQQFLKHNAQSPDTQPSIPDNQYVTFFEALKCTKLREHDIQQVQSLTTSRISGVSIDKESKEVGQFQLDESLIQWTYETGFKTSLDNLVIENST